MSRTHRMNCPACGNTGSFVEDYAEWEERPGPFKVGRPDYNSQLMECREESCDVHHYLPGEEEQHEH